MIENIHEAVKEKVKPKLDEIKILNQWVNVLLVDVGEKKPAKKIYDPKHGWKSASSTNSETWGTYEQVTMNLSKEFTLPYWIRNNPKKDQWKDTDFCKKRKQYFTKVLGFVFTMNDLYGGLDFDNCIKDGEWENDIFHSIVDDLKTYTEISISETGAKSLMKFKNIEEKQRLHQYIQDKFINKGTGIKNDNVGIEFYLTGRYFALTGNMISGYDTIGEVEVDKIIEIIEKYIKPEQKKNIHTSPLSPLNDEEEVYINTESDICKHTPMTYDDNEIINKCMKHSNQNNWFSDIWNHLGNSEDDFTIVKSIAYYTQDIDQITRIMRNSPMYREKFDRDDYLKNTANNAFRERIIFAEKKGIFAFWQGDKNQSKYKIPNAFRVKNNSLYRIEKTKSMGVGGELTEDEEFEKEIYLGPMIYIDGICVDDLGKQQLVFKIAKQLITVSYENLMTKQKIIANLACYGLSINDSNAKYYINYIAAFLLLNESNLHKYKKYNQLGWDDNDFIPYKENIVLNPQLKNMLKTKGDFNIWRTGINKYRENKFFRFMFGLYIASVILPIISERGFIVHHWGLSRTGKTTLAYTCLSIWGEPENLGTKANFSPTTLEIKAYELNHIPLYIDEEKENNNSKHRDFSDIIYMLADGKGRGRSNRDITRQLEKKWKSIIFSSAEMSLAKDKDMEGIHSRLLEFNAKPFDNEKTAKQAINLYKKHYGFGKKFIEVIKKINFDKLDYHVEDNENKLSTHIIAVELAILGDYIASIVLENINDIDRSKQALKNVVNTLKDKTDFDQTPKIYDFLIQKIVENHKYIENMDLTSDMSMSNGKIVGKADKKEKEISILKTVAEKWLIEAGYNVNVAKTRLIEQGLIKKSDNALARRRIRGARPYVYCFNWDFEKKEI